MVTALHNRENCGTGFSRKLQLVLVVNLASGVTPFSVFSFFIGSRIGLRNIRRANYVKHSKIHYDLPKTLLNYISNYQKHYKTSVFYS